MERTKDWQALVTVEPPEACEFVKYSNREKYNAYLYLINGSDECVHYSIQTTNPMNYVVKPSKGILQQGET